MLLIAVVIGTLLAIMLVALAVYGAEQMTRPPRCDLEDTAERWGLPEPRHVWLTTTDGMRLSAWWFNASSAPASVIVCHGHGGNKHTSLWVAADLFPRFNVLLLDLRGHGQSDGARTSVGFLERLDILAAVSWLDDQLGERPIGVLGISMGGATAILAAAESPRIAAVAADSPFARLRSPVAAAVCQRGYPRAVSPLLAWSICAVANRRVRGGREPLDVVQRLAPRPLLIIHGEADELTPVQNAYALYERAGEPKQLWVVPEVGHARVPEVEPRRYAERVGGFFDRWLLPGPSVEARREPAAAARTRHGDDVVQRELTEVDRG